MYDNILTVAQFRQYFPALPEEQLSNEMVEQLIGSAVAKINLYLGVKIESGAGVTVTQQFKYEDYPARLLRLKLPADTTKAFTITEGPTMQPVPVTQFITYSWGIHRNPGYSSLYYFDKVTPLVPGFVPPLTVTYTPLADVYLVLRDSILQLIRLQAQRLDLHGTGEGAFARIASVVDNAQEVTYNAEPAETAIYDAIDKELERLGRLFRGPRIG
jgi:hypothetical protein